MDLHSGLAKCTPYGFEQELRREQHRQYPQSRKFRSLIADQGGRYSRYNYL